MTVNTYWGNAPGIYHGNKDQALKARFVSLAMRGKQGATLDERSATASHLRHLRHLRFILRFQQATPDRFALDIGAADGREMMAE